MAGHSKWANTKHRKSAQDIKRSKIFTKIIKKITVYTKKYGSNIHENFKLRKLLEQASAFNVKKTLIHHAIQRTLKKKKKKQTMKYAGYGPDGIALIIQCETDNSNRTVSSIRNVFSKNGVKLVEYNCVKHLFDCFNIITIQMNINTKKNILNIIRSNKLIRLKETSVHTVKIIVKKKDFIQVKKYCSTNFIHFDQIKIYFYPKMRFSVNATNKDKILNIINLLKKLKETIKVIHNAEM